MIEKLILYFENNALQLGIRSLWNGFPSSSELIRLESSLSVGYSWRRLYPFFKAFRN